jgi:hypothetical protein
MREGAKRKARKPASPEGRSPGEDLERSTRPRTAYADLGARPYFIDYARMQTLYEYRQPIGLNRRIRAFPEYRL